MATRLFTAECFSQYDHHTVRMFNVETRALTRRAILVGDRATLWKFVDWRMSPSSNSAAGMVMREAMLLRQYGTAYPVPEAEIKRFFSQTPKPELTALFGAGVRLRTVQGQRQELHELDRDHRVPGRRPEDLLHGHADLQRAAQELGGRAPGARGKAAADDAEPTRRQIRIWRRLGPRSLRPSGHGGRHGAVPGPRCPQVRFLASGDNADALQCRLLCLATRRRCPGRWQQ
jgi:hypothetical protein